MNELNRVQKQESNTKYNDLTKSVLITAVSKFLEGLGSIALMGLVTLPPTAPVILGSAVGMIGGGALAGIAGYFGAFEYEKSKGEKVNKGAYALASAAGLGFVNPYTYNLVKPNPASL